MPYALIFLAALSRVLPHPPNFTPVAAMALFGAATLPDRRVALLAPLAALLLSDALIGFYGPWTMAGVYGATLLSGLLGRAVLADGKGTAPRVAGTALGGSVLFFLVTNGVCWWTGYPHTWQGAATCYTLALPFFRNEIAGTLLGVLVLFGGHALFTRRRRAVVAA